MDDELQQQDTASGTAADRGGRDPLGGVAGRLRRRTRGRGAAAVAAPDDDRPSEAAEERPQARAVDRPDAAVPSPDVADRPEGDGVAADLGAGSDAGAVDDPADPEGGEGGEGGASTGTGARRRRGRRGGRGRRGRGRPAGEGAATSDEADDADDEGSDGDAREDDDASATGDGAPASAARTSSRTRGGSAGRSGRGGGGGRGAAGPASRARALEDEDEDDEEREDGEDRGLEDAIAKGGTRLAAKRGRRDGGGRDGGGRDGGGREGGSRDGGRRRERPGGVPEEVRRAILEGPPRTMLVTAGTDRTQIAVLEDRTLVEHYVTRAEDVTFVGNMYMGRVQNVLPGMEAAFIDIGKGRNGVLYAGEVLYDELDLEEGDGARIENVLKPGQKVLVQVTKDPMGSKGPRLTMHLSLAGRYVVLAPNSDLFGISRKLTDRERDRLRRIVKSVKPEQHGIIVRTAAEDIAEEQIVADVERLLAKWAKVEANAASARALAAVYEEPPLVVKVIRDNFGPTFERCIVDDETLHAQVRDYLDEVAPELLAKVELYGAPTDDSRAQAAGAPSSDTPAGGPSAAERRRDLPPLFDVYDVADQLRKAMNRKVWLPSGGYLIIESTEAMKVIDVNTGKFTGDSDTNLEEIVLKTNLEAADEIVRQLRLRDMGGMIVIDFIDMLLKSNQDQVVRRLKRELLRDRTKTRVSEVSRLGLVQMTRKNVSQGLIESFSHSCEACDGRGFISELV